MEMKLFIGEQPEAVAVQVNEWLSENQYTVCHITQSQCEHQGNLVFVISIFYDLNKDR
jgi:hypothetical protein